MWFTMHTTITTIIKYSDKIRGLSEYYTRPSVTLVSGIVPALVSPHKLNEINEINETTIQ